MTKTHNYSIAFSTHHARSGSFDIVEVSCELPCSRVFSADLLLSLGSHLLLNPAKDFWESVIGRYAGLGTRLVTIILEKTSAF